MSGILYRHYQAGDEHSIIELWNQCLRKDPITPKRFRNLVLLDANFDPQGLRLAFDQQQQLVGVLYFIRRLLPMKGTDLESKNGWITFFFVKESHQRLGIGSKLMEDALQFLQKNGREYVFFSSYAPNYILPGIDAKTYPQGHQFLLKQGFKKQYSPIAMDYSLIDFDIPEDVEELKQQRISEGYSFGSTQDSDLYNLIQFATHVFNPDWGRAIREGILHGLPQERILTAKYGDKIVGFCLYGGYEGIPERFGPFGVDPEQRGKGIGKVLLYDCLAAMRSEGLHGAWFLWTGETTPAGILYKRAGFQITRKFHVMKKELKHNN